MGNKLPELKSNTKVPAPGTYDPSISFISRNEPAFSMKARHGDSLLLKSLGPGPGNYEIHLKNKRDAPKFGFGSSKRD